MMKQSLPPSLLSRRAFLAASAALTAQTLLTNKLHAAEGFTTDGGLVTLPAKGTLYIANDFHTRHADFDRWLKRSDLVAKLKSDPDVYGLVLGDVLDAKRGDSESEADGDIRILDRIRQIQSEKGGDRLIYILGNHEHESIQLFTLLKEKAGMTPQNQAALIRRLYATVDGDFFRQWNSLERINEEHEAWFKKLPVAVLCGNGVLCVHAGPARKAQSPKDLATRNDAMIEDMVWCRPTEKYDNDASAKHFYEASDVDPFLKKMNDSKLMIVGHTPLPTLPAEWIKDGLGHVGEHCVVMGASFGSMPNQKNYLAIDLARKYASSSDLQVKREIQPVMG